MARIEISVEPPAGHGTISVIGLVGYSCAPAAAEHQHADGGKGDVKW